MKRGVSQLRRLTKMAEAVNPPSQSRVTCPLCFGGGRCDPRLIHMTSDAISRARVSLEARASEAFSRPPLGMRHARNPQAQVRLPPLERGAERGAERGGERGRVLAKASDSWPQQAIKTVHNVRRAGREVLPCPPPRRSHSPVALPGGKSRPASLPPVAKSATEVSLKKQSCVFFVDLAEEPATSDGGGSDGGRDGGRRPRDGARDREWDTGRRVLPPISEGSAHRPRSSPSLERASANQSDSSGEQCDVGEEESEERAESRNPATSYGDSEPLSHSTASDLYRRAIVEIASSDWDCVVSGLIGMSRVMKYAPQLVEDSGELPALMRTVTALVRSLRSKVAIAACRASYTIFKRIDCTRRPAFDQLVGSLLVRTGDMNKFLRNEAMRALTAMAEYIPILNSVRALVDQGARNKNDLVRAATAQMLDLVIATQGPGPLMDKREIREKLCPVVAALLEDCHPDTRAFAKQAFASLRTDDRFGAIFKSLIRPTHIIRLQKVVGPID